MLGKNFPDMLLFSKRKPHKSNAFLVVFQAGGSGSEGRAWDDSRLLSGRVGPSEEKAMEAVTQSYSVLQHLPFSTSEHKKNTGRKYQQR